MEGTYRPHDDWAFALRHAREFHYANKQYPTPSGKRIQDIEVVYDQFTIPFEDGAQRTFFMEGGD